MDTAESIQIISDVDPATLPNPAEFLKMIGVFCLPDTLLDVEPIWPEVYGAS